MGVLPMKHLRFTHVLASVALALGFLAPRMHAADAPKFELKSGDRVLFLGDTFFEREGDYGHIEARLTTAFPDQNVAFRNLSWAGDTPMGRARASFDWNKSPEDWLKRVKEQLDLVRPTVVFLSYGMTATLEAAALKSPDAQTAYVARFKSEIGRLLNAVDEVSGQRVSAVILGPLQIQGDRPDSARASVALAVSQALQTVASERPLSRFVDVLQISRRMSMLRMKTYDSPVIPDEKGYQYLADRIAEDLGLAKIETKDSELLLGAIRKKNELFFHRWRPENWTYLFGFRKHEQGRNAVEIPQFEPLIVEWEGLIGGLRHLKAPDANAQAKVKTRLAQAATPKPRREITPQPVPTFTVAEGFEVNLWAENPELFKPIQMNWDAQGRLWLASSRTYPQIAPGQDAADSVVVLEDTNGDGKADKSTVFADGLLIPTGVLPDNKGGVYVAASSQLLHFADTNGDGKADKKTIVMTSFGTEDTHHNLHTLRWGYDGHLYMNQSIYTHSHIETVHGVRRLNSAGIWRFHPETWELEIFTKGGCNPWGHHWDQFGNSFFTDGAGGKGIYHAMEGATYFTYSDMRREGDSISPGNYPKFASLEAVHSPAFPADWQGNLITCDFRAHRVVRFALSDVGSTFQTKEMPDLLRSTNVTFRPIDLRFGPDGALYIADWSNPIIQHGEVDFRDPRRDHEHGRVWRVAAKAGMFAKRQDLTKLSNDALLDRTLSKYGWEQEQSRAVLRQRSGNQVLSDVRQWVARQSDPRAKLEAMWLHEAFGKPSDELLVELVAAQDERVRTAVTRQLSR